MPTAAVICPSARRPHNARELCEAFEDTADPASVDLILAVDDDDPHLPGYRQVEDAHPWITLWIAEGSPHRIGPIINQAAMDLLDSEAPPDLIGFMGDDHRPQTPGWNQILGGELKDRIGVAYGNDMHQRGKLPTACLISAPLVRAMGGLAPPGVGHLFLDDWWLRVGKVTHLAYRDDVIIEHLHPDAGKAPDDETYARGGRNYAVWSRDETAFDRYLHDRGPDGWDACLARIADLMRGAAR